MPQSLLALKVITEPEKEELVTPLLESETVEDSASGVYGLRRAVSKLQKSGYLLASLDSIRVDSLAVTGIVYVGRRFEWGNLNVEKLPKDLRRSIFGTKRNNWILTDKVQQSFNDILATSNNSGFPFAAIKLDSVKIRQSRVSGSVNYHPGPLIRFDTLKVSNGNEARMRYLSGYLKIRAGEVYSEKKVNQIPEYFENLPYYVLSSPVHLLFHNENAEVEFEAERVKSNRFDGIVGILPNAAADGRALLTGEMNLELLNLFESGKELRFHWQRLREETQSLDIGFRVPNLLKSQVDLFGRYRQLKEDTTFINRNARIGLGLRLSPRSEVNFFTDFKSAGLLSTSAEVQDQTPENLDFDLTRYGGGYSYNTLSYLDLRDQGVRFTSEISVGTKKIRRNSGLDESVYEGINLNTTFYQFEMAFAYQLSLSRQLTFYQQLSSGNIINDNVFNNDMFRIGGLNTLRGFNENFFFAKNYLLSNAEVRLHFDRSSFLFLFYDYSFIRTQSGNVSNDTHPMGFGLGLQLYTKVGDLKLAYALGRSEDQPLDFNLAKIHFGLINRF